MAMARNRLDIVCTACGADTFVRQVPEYDGFVKVRVRFVCAVCAHEFDGEENVPFKEKKTVNLFDEDNKPKKPVVFNDGETARTCRRCIHYVVNPFAQRCGLRQEFVEATDGCESFSLAAAR